MRTARSAYGAPRHHAPVGCEPPTVFAPGQRHERKSGRVSAADCPGEVEPARGRRCARGRARPGPTGIIDELPRGIHADRLGYTGIEQRVPRRTDRHVPVDRRERRGQVDRHAGTRDAHAQPPRFLQDHASLRCGPLGRAAPVQALRDLEDVVANGPAVGLLLDDATRRATLERVVDVEVVRVGFLATLGGGHVRMYVVGGHPQRLVVRVVGRRLAGHREARRCEHRVDARAHRALRQAEERLAVVAQQPAVRGRPRARRQADRRQVEIEAHGLAALMTPTRGPPSRPDPAHGGEREFRHIGDEAEHDEQGGNEGQHGAEHVADGHMRRPARW